MKKYDCNKTLDCIHEQKRLCDSMLSCSAGCPLKEYNCVLQSMDQESIDILQKWSDENPEAAILTKKDRAFLECFAGATDNRRISRDSHCVYYEYGGVSNMLSFDMFKALEPNTTMTFDELLRLEVED